MGAKKKKKQDLGQFKPFSDLWYAFVKPQGAPFVGPKGLDSCLSFSTSLLALDQCNNKEIFYLSEMSGGQILKKHDLGQFWPFLVLWGPHGIP